MRQAAGAKPIPVAAENRRLVNLRRAAQYPWTDEGACAAREAAGEWRALVERCFGALDLSRIRFRDIEHRCPVAQADATTLEEMVGICLLIQPEVALGAIVLIGVVLAAPAIAAEIAKTDAKPRETDCDAQYEECKRAAGKGRLEIYDCDNCRRFCQKEGWWDPRVCKGFGHTTR